MEDLRVTVWFSTYNQEPYVAQALDSILIQKTSFPFEIVAADDCSTDRTQEIILDYQKRYPDKIVTYFTPENFGGCRKLTGCIDAGLFRGEYLSYLEGDDYWLGEDRLQTLVDYLETHPEYSRVSHRRKVIDENGKDCGYDIPEDVLGKPFTIEDFLTGKNYSDFGGVFRNYFKEAGNRYHELFWASRNVLDFQDMFITQDFGPVFVMDAVYGAYRSRSIKGATNYNSITSYAARRKENICLAHAVENFYCGRYDLSPMIRSNQLQLLQQAVAERSEIHVCEVLDLMCAEDQETVLPSALYFLLRGKQFDDWKWLLKRLPKNGVPSFLVKSVGFALRRIHENCSGGHGNPDLRGYIRQE